MTLQNPDDLLLRREDLLRRQLLAFSIAHEISGVIGAARDEEAIWKSLTEGLRDMLRFERQVVFRIDSHNLCLHPLRAVGMDLPVVEATPFGLRFSDGEYGDAVFLNRHVVAEQLPEEDPFLGLGSKSYLALPISVRLFGAQGQILRCQDPTCPCQTGTSPFWWTEPMPEVFQDLSEDQRRQKILSCPEFKCFGVLWLDLTDREPIGSDEVTAISSSLTQAALILQNFRSQDLLRATNRQLAEAIGVLEEINRANSKELDKAHRIQKGLLPRRFPKQLLKDVAAHYVPTSRVGGDYYDCFALDSTRLGMVIADVSGHGIAAGLFMSMFKVLVKSYAASRSPADVIREINQTFLVETSADHFITVFLGIFDIPSRRLRYINAGHTPTLLLNRANDTVTQLSSTGMLVGALEEFHCGEKEVVLEPDSRIFLYTDGVSEAESQAGVPFGIDRLQTLLRRDAGVSCGDFLENLMAELDAFTGRHTLDDDVTLLTIDL